MKIPAIWSWQKFSNALFKPKPEGLEAKIQTIKQSLPVPIFWLLGKAQSGKTSIIRALTGNNAAEIGNGFQACTQSSRFYDFPSASHPLIRFLDTRGLGEKAYEPSEDLAWCAEQAHVLIVVMRVLDMAQFDVVKAVKTIHAEHKDWPIIVVQSALHEAYLQPDAQHIQPYPYQITPFPESVPHDLARALWHQRAWFDGLPVHFVALDFTLPEDGFQPVYYGLDEFWDTLERCLPNTLLSLLRNSAHYDALLDFHARQAQPHILSFSLVNIGLGAIPIAGLPLVLSVQAKAFHSIASIYGLSLTKRLYSEFATLLGSGVVLGLLGRELVKFVPGYGWSIAGVYSGAMTYALCRAFCVYLQSVKRGALPEQAAIKQAYQHAMQEAYQVLKQRQTP
ncbi:hypothetical protein VZ94_05310 [Methylocucumis oryzae]|uniref:G domain-containing protein n=2 Tax=Methylocucumis oryzae TaxID=1632867 RepID=A0A0F3IKX1_9GAMM|nr:hypothetical protein VZ94_05310 [Methylocucumis oryzae]